MDEGTYLELKRLAQPAPRDQQVHVPSLSLVVFYYELKKYLYSADMMLQIFQEFPNLIHWPV